jgi:DNA-binding transcriptional regulator GbsR (MarR family)
VSTHSQRPETAPAEALVPFEGLDAALAAELPTFELFFKTFGFKRVHGRIWGLLVLAGQPLSAREVSDALSLSQGATSTALNELIGWGAVTSEFDSPRRCHLHAPVRNTLSIVATVIRRREQVVFAQFKQASAKTLAYVTDRYGERDPRVLTLRSIVSTCEIAEAVMNLVVSSVANALDDSQSILHKAISAALRVGAVPGRLLIPPAGGKRARKAAAIEAAALVELEAHHAGRERDAR